MHENRLKTTNSFVSEATIQQMPSLPYRPSPLSKEYQDEQPSSGSKAKNYLQKTKNVSLQLLKKYWFLLGLAIAIILATQVPDVARKDGYIHAEWSIKWGCVIVIFLISGLSLRTQTLAQTILRIRLHLLIQTINLIIIPFFVFGLVLLLFKLHTDLSSLLLIGVVIAASTPTTVSSNVVMTKNAKGNEATALMNAALGNVLGIFVSPALVSTFEKPLYNATPEDESQNTAGGHVDFVSVLKQLGITVLAPLVIGQIIQWTAPEKVAKFKVKCRLSDVSNVALLFMVWSVFSDAVHSGSFSSMSAKDFVAIAIMNAGLYVLFSSLSFFLAYLPLPPGMRTPRWIERIRYSREDTVAVMYCGATKTVAMGVPLINVLYQNGDPGTIGVLSTPLLLYHIEQLILGNFEVELLRKWVQSGKKRESSTSTKDGIDEPYPQRRDEEDQIMDCSATRIDSRAMSGLKASEVDNHACPHGSTMVAPGSSVAQDSCPECCWHANKPTERP